MLLVSIYYSSCKYRLTKRTALPNNRLRVAAENGMLPPYTLVIVLQLPGPSTNYSIVFYFVPKLEFIPLFEPNLNPHESKKLVNEMKLPPKYDDMIQEFFFGSSDKARNERLKMIPRITDGPWVIRNSVPSKPVLMGK